MYKKITTLILGSILLISVMGMNSDAYTSFKATCYCLSGKTASGEKVRSGIVAADTRIYKLGTKIHVQDKVLGGTYIVKDTGASVKGKHLDFWVSSCSRARQIGIRNVQVKRL